jgi:hypothetical protein
MAKQPKVSSRGGLRAAVAIPWRTAFRSQRDCFGPRRRNDTYFVAIKLENVTLPIDFCPFHTKKEIQ